jgi:hypothetical protein
MALSQYSESELTMDFRCRWSLHVDKENAVFFAHDISVAASPPSHSFTRAFLSSPAG